MELLDQKLAYGSNIQTLATWKQDIARLIIPSVTWKGFPKTVDTLYLEKQLYYKGQVIVFATDDGLVCLSGFGTNRPNLYNIMTQRTVTAPNGFTADLTDENSVIIYNNCLRQPTAPLAATVAKRLAEYDIVIDQNIKAQKNPYILLVNQLNQLSVKNFYSQIDSNLPVIEIDDFSEIEKSIKCLDLKVPFQAKDIRLVQRDIFNDFALKNGISAPGDEKAERLNTAEILTANSMVAHYREDKLKPRRQAAEQITQMFANYIEEPITVDFTNDGYDQLKERTDLGYKDYDPTLEGVNADE